MKVKLGRAEIAFKSPASVREAMKFMDGAQIDGNVVALRILYPPKPNFRRRCMCFFTMLFGLHLLFVLSFRVCSQGLRLATGFVVSVDQAEDAQGTSNAVVKELLLWRIGGRTQSANFINHSLLWLISKTNDDPSSN